MQVPAPWGRHRRGVRALDGTGRLYSVAAHPHTPSHKPAAGHLSHWAAYEAVKSEAALLGGLRALSKLYPALRHTRDLASNGLGESGVPLLTSRRMLLLAD